MEIRIAVITPRRNFAAPLRTGVVISSRVQQEIRATQNANDRAHPLAFSPTLIFVDQLFALPLSTARPGRGVNVFCLRAEQRYSNRAARAIFARPVRLRPLIFNNRVVPRLCANLVSSWVLTYIRLRLSRLSRDVSLICVYVPLLHTPRAPSVCSFGVHTNDRLCIPARSQSGTTSIP